MANKTILKNISYSRAHFGILEQNKTLQEELTFANNFLPLPEERVLIHKGLSIKGYKFDTENEGLLLHIVVYESGLSASLVDNAEGEVNPEVSTYDSPINKDYLQKEAFILVKNNDVLFLGHGARESLFLAYAKGILGKVNSIEASENLEIDKISNVDKVKLINDEGIQQIHLNTSLYQATTEYLNNQNNSLTGVRKLLAQVGHEFSQLFSEDKDALNEAENLNVKLSIAYDGVEARSHSTEPNFGKAGKKTLLNTAEDVLNLEDEDFFDGFELITGKGKSIKYSSIKIQGKYRVKSLGTGLSTQDAWLKLRAYYIELKGNGIIEQ